MLSKHLSKALCLVAVAFALALQVPARPQEQTLRVAAAADLKFAMDDLAHQYQQRKGVTIDVTYGSSGNFFAQIQNGAPFDIFFSADISYPQKLEAAGLTEPGTLYNYAVGQIVIWMPPESELDLQSLGWRVLLDGSVKKIAIANPDHAPYGRAAVAALTKVGLYEQLKAKFVYGENISQTAQFVQSGNAQAGIIAESLASSPAMKGGKAWKIPAETHPPIEQAAVVLKSTKNKAAATAFLDFVKGDFGREALQKYGFTIPGQAQ